MFYSFKFIQIYYIVCLLLTSATGKSISVYIHHDEEVVVGEEPYDLPGYIDLKLNKYSEYGDNGSFASFHSNLDNKNDSNVNFISNPEYDENDEDETYDDGKVETYFKDELKPDFGDDEMEPEGDDVEEQLLNSSLWRDLGNLLLAWKLPPEVDDDLQLYNNKLENELTNIVRVKTRNRRKVAWDVNKMAKESWTKAWTKPPTLEEKKKKYYKKVLVISEEDIQKARDEKLKEIFIYIGSTLGTVLVFLIFFYALIRCPDFFICGCCFSRCIVSCLCPSFAQFLDDPRQYLQDRFHEYIPGLIVHEDGTLEHYPPSEEELDALQGVIEAMGDGI